ncbi:MAG: DUF309 domain-containing protein, partial [Proteobacteria bacterium]|nr:DUF309 domain-containing protein [Pseudomonadota bacterium]
MSRYSSRALPSVAYVPGASPRADRPRDRHATSHGDRLATDEDFRHGVDLFNHGFPWEAHEAWEPLWRAAPR